MAPRAGSEGGGREREKREEEREKEEREGAGTREVLGELEA